MKVAVIGTWHVHTDEYTKAIVDNKNSELVCVWDPSEEKGKDFAEKYGVPFVANYSDILNNKGIDSVMVCTATNEHIDVIPAAAKAGKNIFTEKVLCFTEAQAKEVCKEIEKAGVKFTISFPHRTMPKVRFLKELCDSGSLGKITYVRVRNVHNGATANWLPPHFYDKSQCGGGAMMDLGAHPMYLLNWFLGDPKAISSTFTSVTGKPVEDNAVSVIEFEGGAIGVSETGFVAANYPYVFEVSGTDGAAMIVGDNVSYCNKDTDNKWIQAEKLPDAVPLPINAWIDDVSQGKEPPFGTKDAIGLSKMMEGAYISFEKGVKHVY